MNMKTTLILLFSLFVITMQAGNIKGNGKVITKDISISDYDQIVIGGGINCQGGTTWLNKSVNPEFEYEQSSGKATLQITTDENLFPLLTVEVVGSKLTISRKNDKDQLMPTKFAVKGKKYWLLMLLQNVG